MQESEEIKCGKCFSLNPSSMDYCKYCHRKFSYSFKVIDEAKLEEKRINRKMAIVSAGLLVLVTSYIIFK